MRVVGLTRISLDEYPREAVREAVVNAIAHRNYEDRTRQILVKLFVDRLEILSPGEPLKPLTVAKIKRGNCQPCSRNPIIGQYLNHLRLMDQRGSGIGRMKTAMLNHGLTAPTYDLIDGYFRVTLKGPEGNLDQLRVPEGISAGIPLAVEKQLNDRQREIIKHISLEGFVTSGWCRKKFGVTYNTTYRDLSALVSLEILTPTGRGRSTRYVPKVESL
jgi:predicted HTH transcriptional regulator